MTQESDWQAVSDAVAYAPEDLRDAARSAIYRLWIPTAAAQDEVGRMDALVEAFNKWPADIRKKLSLHDLRRMTGWTPPT